MAFARPTLAELVTRVQADFVSRLALTGALLRRAMVYVFSRVVAGAAHMLHGHLDFLGRQLFPDLSEGAYLVRQASLYGVTQTAPTYATATVGFTGVDGTTMGGAARLVRSDGAEYTLDADVTIAVGAGSGSVTALVPGALGTLTPGVVLAFESPEAGFDSTGTVVASVADGTDTETVEALRVRLLERLAEPAHGGTDADYVAWAKEVAGVTRVWVAPLGLGPGTVVVRFARDNDVSPIPDAGEVAAVQAALDAAKPAHATVTAFAPVAFPVDFDISPTPNTLAVKDAITQELGDLILRIEPGGTILLSAVRTAIGSAAGVTDYAMTTPVADVTLTTNQLPTLGTITWY